MHENDLVFKKSQFIRQPWGLIRWWLTPRATQQEEAFRERTQRATILLFAIVSIIVIAAIILLPLPIIRLLHWILTFIITLAAGWAIHRQKMQSANYLMGGVLLFLIGVVQWNSGYWSSSIPMLIGLGLIYSGILIKQQQLFYFAFSIGFIYTLITSIQSHTALPIENPLSRENSAFANPIAAIIFTNWYIFMFTVIEVYLIEELRKRAQIVQSTIAHLDETVRARTAELETAKCELEQTLEKALESDRLKSLFLANVNHEFRTPLNAILNFNQFVSSGLFGEINPKQVDALNKSTESARHLLALINDILDLSKIEAGYFILNIEENIDLKTEIESVLAIIQSLVKVELKTDFPNTLTLIALDKRRFRQVLINLLSNAAKFTTAGYIKLSLQLQEQRLLLSIEDTGPGIPEDEQANIFEPFRQVRKIDPNLGGTGLGLSISRRLIEAHGGQLWLESEVGHGSTFYISLPY